MEKQIARKILENTAIRPKTGIILGTGFSSVADKVKADYTLDTNDIENYPKPRVKGHGGKIILGRLGKAEVVLFAGRPHFYEGHSTRDVTLPVRIMKELGCEAVVLTNAAGAINDSFRAGEFALITDHISHNLSNPLIGANYKFVDMCNAYDRGLRDSFKKHAAETGFKINEGVYIYFTGPSFETPAEIRMARAFGADLVGMSTVAEAIVARSLGLRVLGLSFISNMAACDAAPLNHEEFCRPDKTNFSLVASILEKVCI